MKKLTLSLAAIFAMGTFAVAGGDISPVEPVVEEPVVAPIGQFYVGLGYGYFDQTMDDINHRGLNIEAETDNILFQAGYQFNEYIAIEGRYWLGVGDATWSISNLPGIDDSGDYSSWGIYVKPMYPVTDSFNVYALLGYASTSLDADGRRDFYWDTDDFSWGLGAELGVTDNVFVFADYVNLGYPDSFDYTDPDGNKFNDTYVDGNLYTFNIGVTYKF